MFGGPAPQTDPTLWSWTDVDGWRAGASVPAPAMIGPACAFATTRHELLVATGYVPGPLLGGTSNQVATWDGAWHVAQAPNFVAPRVFGALAYDPIRDTSVLFGGATQLDTFGPAVLGDTLAWDGATWTTRHQPEPAPAPRAHHALAWDATLGRVVLFGGEAADGSPLTDTWAWDGITWGQIATDAPAPTGAIAGTMASDPRRGGLVLFGGSPVGGPGGTPMSAVGETWFLRADDPAVPDEGCVAGVDGDGDGLAGCDDPDCACAP